MVYTLPGIRFPSCSSSYKLSPSCFHGDRYGSSVSLLLKKDFRSWKICAAKSSRDSDSSSLTVDASEKVLVPGGPSTDQLETLDAASQGPQTKDEEYAEISNDEANDELDSVPSSDVGDNAKAQGLERSTPIGGTVTTEKDKVRPKSIPPPGSGQRIYKIDPLLKDHCEHLEYRYGQYKRMCVEIDKNEGGLEVFSRGYEKFGFNHSATGITYREWAPGAKSAALIGDFNNWDPNANIMTRSIGSSITSLT